MFRYLVTAAVLVGAMALEETSMRTAHAQTFSAACDVESLKQAIIDSNNSAGADEISLASNCTYTLTTAEDIDEFGGDTGLPLITGELTIEGNGATIERSSAGGTPNFRIMRSTAFDGTLTLKNLTIRNGRLEQEEGARGGGVRVSSHLALEGVTIANNYASASPGASGAGGGGTFSSGDTTLTAGTTYTNNHVVAANGVAQGGGANAFLTLLATDAVFSANSATSTSSSALGGGSSSGGQSVLTDTTYTDNATSGFSASAGAAFANGESTVSPTTILTSTFSLNTVTATGNADFPAEGGAVRTMGNLDVGYSTFIENAVSGIGGARGGGSSSFLATTITKSTYSGNTATGTGTAGSPRPGEGGGAYSLSSLDVVNSTISGNTATGPGVTQGGGLLSVTDLFMKHGTVAGNSATGPDFPRAGGVTSVSGGLTLLVSLVVQSTNGDCSSFSGVTASATNLDSDGSCGSATTTADAGLLPLALNFPGLTATHALEPDSPALNLGTSCELTDQRDVSRPGGPGCDVGAFEAGNDPVPMAFDVDCDNDEDSTDALAILRHLAGFTTGTLPTEPCDGDVDEDTDVDLADAIDVRRHVAGR